MNGNLGEVFNTYNVNILFTVAALPARVSLGGPPGMMPMMQPPANSNAGLIMPGQVPHFQATNDPKVNVIPQPNTKFQPTGQAPQMGKKFGEDDIDESKKHLVSGDNILITKLE